MDLDAGRRCSGRGPGWLAPESLALAGLAISALGWTACGVEPPAKNAPALSELESLAFVAPAECIFPALSGPPLACVTSQALLVDRYEVTRGQWRVWRARTPVESSAAEDEGSAVAAAMVAAWPVEADNWPATFMTLLEAREFAASRGMRLLTSAEWIRVACGPGLQPWPWGPRSASAVANCLDLELYRPVAVGTFEQGRSPDFVYDLVGNVWEWVDGPMPSPAVETPSFDAPMPSPAVETPSGLEWAMGGSYLSKRKRLYDRASDSDRWNFSHQDLDPRTRSCDVGLRCAAEAKAYLRAHAADWGSGEEVRRRLIAVGASWGRKAVPLLEDLADDAVPAPGLPWLLEGARR